MKNCYVLALNYVHLWQSDTADIVRVCLNLCFKLLYDLWDTCVDFWVANDINILAQKQVLWLIVSTGCYFNKDFNRGQYMKSQNFKTHKQQKVSGKTNT